MVAIKFLMETRQGFPDDSSTPVSGFADGELNDVGFVNIVDVLTGRKILLGRVPIIPDDIVRGDVAHELT